MYEKYSFVQIADGLEFEIVMKVMRKAQEIWDRCWAERR